MQHHHKHILQQPLRTPRAAAFAGIMFAILQSAAIIIFQVSIPADSFSQNDWLQDYSRNITLALGLMPFAGIAFLWFIGVIRDRLGHLEDQFFSTLFFGTGLLYLTMTFATAAVAGGLLAVYSFDPDLFLEGGFYVFGRAMIYKFNDVFAIRMAGMFMTVSGTIWLRTKLMPLWLAVSTYLIAVGLLIGISFYPWTTLFFPAWVFVISVYILVLNFRYEHRDGVTYAKLHSY